MFYHCVPGWEGLHSYPSAIFLPTAGYHNGVKLGFLHISCLCLSYPFLCNLFVVAVKSALGSSSGGINPYVAVDLFCLWEEMSSRSSYATILPFPQSRDMCNCTLPLKGKMACSTALTNLWTRLKVGLVG